MPPSRLSCSCLASLGVTAMALSERRRMDALLALACLSAILLVSGAEALGNMASPLRPVQPPAKHDGPLEVFVIAHSHCDPGWLMTYEGYYQQRVKRVLDNVLIELAKDSKRKFNWSESSFLQRWFLDASPDARAQFKHFLDNGQMEIVGGGWVQNDEASPTAEQVIHQMTVGHEFLRKNFGESSVPRVAWQIDPFGHSDLTPQLMHLMGFEGLVINRIHYSIKAQLKKAQQMEFFWTWDESQRFDEGILTHVLHTHYSAPSGFDWEEHAPRLSEKTVETRAKAYVRMMRERAAAYQTNKLLVPFGDDFKFQNANVQFTNMGMIIDYINENPILFEGVTVHYSTVGEYFDAINPREETPSVLFPVFRGDFFPYADNGDSYWTGYYSTRPALKRNSRRTNALVRTGDMAFALARSTFCGGSEGKEDSDRAVTCRLADWDHWYGELDYARQQGGLMMHHDAITGTAKDFVVRDYEERMAQAMAKSSQTVGDMFELLLYGEAIPENTWAPYTTETVFQLEEGEGVPLQLVSSLSWERHELVEVFTNFLDVTVIGPDGKAVPVQIMPWVGFEPYPAAQGKTYRVVFAAELPAVGVATFFLLREESELTTFSASQLADGALKLENDYVEVGLAAGTGTVEYMKDAATGLEVNVQHTLFKYETRNSGAYIMRTVPSALGQDVDSSAEGHQVFIVRGALMDEVTVMFSENQRIRYTLAHTGDFMDGVRLQYSVTAGSNQELVARYETDLKTANSFFTDNGLHTQLRFFEEGLRTEQRYYPTHHFAFLRDVLDMAQFTVFTSQAMGVSSGAAGEIETMLHRHLARDDGRGLGQGVRDESEAQHNQFLMLRSAEQTNRRKQQLRFRLDDPIQVLVCSTRHTASSWLATHNARYSALRAPLPDYLHVLTLQAREEWTDEVVVRTVDLRGEDHMRSAMTHPLVQLDEALVEELRPQDSREVSLSLLHTASTFPDVPCNVNASAVFSVSIDDSIAITDKQNTDEAGVFISMAARKPLAVYTAVDEDLGRENYNINTFLTILGPPLGSTKEEEPAIGRLLGVLPEEQEAGHVGHHTYFGMGEETGKVLALLPGEDVPDANVVDDAGSRQRTDGMVREIEPSLLPGEYPSGEVKFSIFLPVAGIAGFVVLYVYSGRKKRSSVRGRTRAHEFV